MVVLGAIERGAGATDRVKAARRERRGGRAEEVGDLSVREVGENDPALDVEAHLASFAVPDLQGLGGVGAAEGADRGPPLLVVDPYRISRRLVQDRKSRRVGKEC